MVKTTETRIIKCLRGGKMNNPVEQFIKNRKSEIETLIVAVLMATGVNLLVSGLAMSETFKLWLCVLAGLFVILVSIAIYRYQFIATNCVHKRVQGFFLYDVKNREIIDVPNYDIALRMWNWMRSSSDEIKRVWKNNAIGNTQFAGGRLCEEITESHRIVSELLEYCVLEILSACLTDYYDGIEGIKLKRLGRDDAPDVLQNRFLYWYSQEPEDIDSFKKYLEVDGCTIDEAIQRSAKEARHTKPYSRFELVLPKSTIIRRDNNQIVVDDPLFSVTIKSSFTGSNTIIPSNYERLYLKIDENANETKAFAMEVNVDIKFKVRSLFSSKRIKNCAWIDVFLNELDRLISKDYYFEKIGWGTAETIIRSIKDWGK